MSISQDQLAGEKRKGFLVGLAVSELLLLLLLALLLFLLGRAQLDREKDELINRAGGEDVLIVISGALDNAPAVRDRIREDPSIPETWITLSNRGMDVDDFAQTREALAGQLVINESQQRELEETKEALAGAMEEGNEARALLAGSKEENEQLQKDIEQVQQDIASSQEVPVEGPPNAIAGETTLCAYLGPGNPSTERIPTVPIGVVNIEESGITLLRKDYPLDQILVDYLGDTFNPEASERIINSWRIKEKLAWDEFESIMAALNLLGDDFASERKQKCRHYFNYYFEDLDAEILEKFGNLNYTGVKISESEFLDLTFINANTDYRPITIVRPDYPRDALDEMIEGFSFIAFTVSKTGTVLKESIVVIDSSPSDIFDEESRAALETWRFQPQIEEGQAVDVPNVRYRFIFCEGRRDDCF
jgi:TonB family protein